MLFYYAYFILYLKTNEELCIDEEGHGNCLSPQISICKCDESLFNYLYQVRNDQ